jgi:hypothetical protein
MAETNELHARLMEDARNYDPAAHHRGLLGPYRDVLLVWRAKFMSYEQIAATLSVHGIKVSPAGVGVYCRSQFTKAEIERVRREHRATARATTPSPVSNSLPPAITLPPADLGAGRRGPKIARDNY